MTVDPGAEIRHHLLSVATPTLSTLAAEREVEGWPFGSLAPFALRADGTPIVFLSEIAQHTKNLRRDPSVSLFVRDPHATGDAQASWRVTVLGRAHALTEPDDELEEIHARYRERVPAAPSYRATHDFTFFALEPVRVRAIVAAATAALPSRARMTSIDRAGFLVRTEAPDALRYVGFGREIEAREARELFVNLARAAREARPA